ncbi:MAG: biotin--[acetyl-CoA-carboxylase] ligase [Selenomonadaceae bacterium]|nr:biotin--[acetyl-CoA-carboxylase] ligase [Selenomonadaceae bacterium]
MNINTDNIFPEVILDGLDTSCFGKKIHYYDETASTNLEAKKYAKENAPHGSLFIAESQSAGRGRLERAYYTPKYKGLWFSLLLRPKFNMEDAPKCTLLAAVAVALAMKEISLVAEIKWPNDIMHDGKKIAGILTEMVTNPDKTYSVIIGIGINVNFAKEDFPENIRDTATSLQIMKGEKINRAKFLQRVLYFAEKLYNKAEKDGFKEIFDRWREFSITLSKEVRVINAGDGKEFTGFALDIDERGALLVESQGKVRRVLAGDVSIREMGKNHDFSL